MNIVESMKQGYEMCFDDFNEYLNVVINRNNGVKTTVDAWKAFSDIIHWTHVTRLQLTPVTESEKIQPVGGM